MIMVLQYQSIKKYSANSFGGTAVYLTDMPVENTTYDEARYEIIRLLEGQFPLSPNEQSDIKISIDGTKGVWGCEINFSRHSRYLPMSFGIDFDLEETPEETYDRLYDHVINYLDTRGYTEFNVIKNSIEERETEIIAEVQALERGILQIKIPK